MHVLMFGALWCVCVYVSAQWYYDGGYANAAKSLLDAMSMSDWGLTDSLFTPIVQLFCWEGQLDAADSLVVQSKDVSPAAREYRVTLVMYGSASLL